MWNGLYPYQADAVRRMKPGCILCGGVGTGKSLTALAFYLGKICVGGKIPVNGIPQFRFPAKTVPLYIITTARKRDSLEWNDELIRVCLNTDPELSYNHTECHVDSWNNIQKYVGVTNAFFIFDEQRVVGTGAWVKAFRKIAKSNRWILLSATPGDTWMDYVPVFIANGFYASKRQFETEHVVYSRYSKYPKVDYYINAGKLVKERNSILVHMDVERRTTRHPEYLTCGYDRDLYKRIQKYRCDPDTGQPYTNLTALGVALRRCVNSAEDRLFALDNCLEEHPRLIVFYNFDYELDILEAHAQKRNYPYKQWNGHKHEPVPEGDRWLYFVQYMSGAEAWNCVATDAILFYSLHHSYKIMEQSQGRIDRVNTPYTDLYYYFLTSSSPVDIRIRQCLDRKEAFNWQAFFESGG